ncbi:UDP-2,4-diacetamido-2,4,6-trideoxy-beta-L-altropyranose hydrolase [Pseudomonas grimontii]|uniref:UDP-2,4-diacetamido-2,4, 6-trideoxy-beta-L-altropyranose hydrolase n=1 Tax=Pseudomonas grimontii TaxID=129847 RepID=UPI0028E95818|nr:UDP-2,4-diacetamido-2,4,6-trideoxy-beta-L-altropyranose hydrolase [Pseudomonas grimontii]
MDGMVNGLSVVFRVDASLAIGNGHVMRCLSLADGLKDGGARCHFICRGHTGNLEEIIKGRGYDVFLMSLNENDVNIDSSGRLPYLHWLGTTQALDAEECLVFLERLKPDWLIVDHYALDIVWEKKTKSHCRRLMVIDDLADRMHISDILLDQTFGRSMASYFPLVPHGCVLLCGSEYALLGPDFNRLRSYSLNRRLNYKLENLLISLGGVDKDNLTRKVLEALKTTALPESCRITIVMGMTAPWLLDIQDLALTLPWVADVKVNVSNMAQLMSESDFAIGAAGATSWERCCLGLPTAMVVLAENQNFAANLLEGANAVVRLPLDGSFDLELAAVIDKVINNPDFLKTMSECAKALVTGNGCGRVVENLVNLSAADG